MVTGEPEELDNLAKELAEKMNLDCAKCKDFAQSVANPANQDNSEIHMSAKCRNSPQ